MAFGAHVTDDGSMAWRAHGACRGIDPSIFYPEIEEDPESDVDPAADAKAVCDVCPVREPCLEHALSRREKAGVWGGLTTPERRRLIRRRRRRAS